MDPRSILALTLTGLAAAVGLGLVALKQLGVKSYGHPAGRVIRAGNNLCVIIETCDPYMPSLKGRPESDMSYSYELWSIPETADGKTLTFTLDKGVRSSDRTHNIGAQQFISPTLWYSIKELQGIDPVSGKKTTTAPPTSLVNTPISQLMGSYNENPLEPYRQRAIPLPAKPSTSPAPAPSADSPFPTPPNWLSFATDDELKTDLKPGKRLYENPPATGTYKPRTLYTLTLKPAPIPTADTATRLGTLTFRNGAFMRSAPNGPAVRFTNPDGYLIVHQDGDAVNPTIHLSRLNTDGTIAWTANTGIGRLTQILPHDNLPCFIGEPPQQLTEPMLTVINLTTGKANTKSLKGPLN